jgi:hypothetical protein
MLDGSAPSPLNREVSSAVTGTRIFKPLRSSTLFNCRLDDEVICRKPLSQFLVSRARWFAPSVEPAGRRHLGVDAPSAGRRHTVPPVRRRAARRQINRQRLCEGGVLQRQRLEDQLAHDRGQGMAAHICYRCLRNCCAATLIPELQPRNEINDDREIVGWRRAVQYLSHGWPWARGGVAGKSMDRHTAGVTEKLAKRDARSPVPIRWNTPRGQILLYVVVHCDLTVLNQPHRTECKNRFAYRTGLEQRVRADWLRVTVRPYPEAALPGNERSSVPQLRASFPSYPAASGAGQERQNSLSCAPCCAALSLGIIPM